MLPPNAPLILHSLTRKYCVESIHEIFVREFDERERPRRLFESKSSKEARIDLLVAQRKAFFAAQIYLETIEADVLPELVETRNLIFDKLNAASKYLATTMPTKVINSEHQNVMQKIYNFINELVDKQQFDGEKYPYRRLLNSQEQQEIKARMKQRWGMGDHYWYPLHEKTDDSLIAYSVKDFRSALDDESLIKLIIKLGFSRIYSISEFNGLNFVQDTALATIYYGDGGECFWFPKSLEWIIYCSHEQTITLGGTLAEYFLINFPEVTKIVWD